MPKSIIKLANLTKQYQSGKQTAQVLQGIHLDIEEGDFLAIVGTSGSGKTTLLNIVGGLDRDYTGEVLVAGYNLAQLTDRHLSQFRNEKVGFVFQQFHLLEHLSCVENVMMPAMFGTRFGKTERARALAALARVGMDDRAEDVPANLSGGQKQRVAIARALFSQPRLLLCDEPTGNLDTRTGQQIIDLFVALNRDDRITLVIVTHETRVAAAARRIIRLEDGRLASESIDLNARSPLINEAI